MICPYCKEEFFCPDKQKESSKETGEYGSVCKSCQCLFVVDCDSQKIVATTVMVTLNNVEYWIVMDYEDKTTTIKCPVFIDYERKTPNKNHTQVWHTYIVLPTVIKISPQNAIKKLKTILNFS